MDYSFWSGEIQGKQEKLIENFGETPTVGYAVFALIAAIKMRLDFLEYKRNGFVWGDLPPLDKRLVTNIFAAI